MALKIKTHIDPALIIAGVEALTKNKVMVGVPSTTAGRTDGAITNAAIAYVQNFGSPKLNIPPREFLYSGLETVRERIIKMLYTAAQFAIAGDKASTIQALHAVGIVAQNGIRAKITSGPFIPLAPLTLANRRAKGRKGIKPLIDTGQLRRAITYVLRGDWF